MSPDDATADLPLALREIKANPLLLLFGCREEKLGSGEGGGTRDGVRGGHLEDEWVFWAEWRKSFFLGDEDISGLMEPRRKGQWANTALITAFTAIAIPPSVRCVIFLTLCSLQQPSVDFYMRILESGAVLRPKGVIDFHWM